jgi:hypothetical protein
MWSVTSFTNQYEYYPSKLNTQTHHSPQESHLNPIQETNIMDITHHINALSRQVLALVEHMEHTDDPAELASLKAQAAELQTQLDHI